MSRIILEGVDGTGKTTLGMRLADECRLGYYRKRCMHGIPEETERALRMTDCVLDRSWMTDVIYSKVYGRVPGCSRASIYKFGLLAARNCCLYLTLQEETWSETSKTTDRYRLDQAYSVRHWSVPYKFSVGTWARPSESSFDSLIQMYKNHEKIVDACPSSGLGSAGPCDVLVNWTEPTPIICDLMFACGVAPWQVHFADFRESSDKLNEWFQPKLIIGDLKNEINMKSFESAREKLSSQLLAAGCSVNSLEAGWRVLKEGPQ